MKGPFVGPNLESWRLKNGATCITAHMPQAPLTCLDIWFRAGSFFENLGEEGTAHFLEHMVFKGSIKSKAGEFDRKIESLGGSSNAATGFDDVHYYVLVPPKVVPEALDLLLDLAINPLLLEDDFIMEREVVLEEIAQHEDQPEDQVFQKLLSNCWRNHPYGRPILGYTASLKKSNPQLMRAFHRRLYTARNCCLSISGNIPNNIETIIENTSLKELHESPIENSRSGNYFPLKFHKIQKEIKVERLHSTRLLMAWPLPPASDQVKIMGIDIATSMLAEGRRSRLVNKLREELQIVESIDMELTSLEHGGILVLEACCEERNLNNVQKQINYLLKNMAVNKFKKDEVNRASNLLINGLFFGLETPGQVCGLSGSQTLWGREESIINPLKSLDHWTELNLKDEVFESLDPDLASTLIATPV